VIPVKDKYQLRNWELVSINPNNRDWSWFDFFNFWAVSIQSIIGFSLIASLYLLYDLNSLVVLSGTLFAGLIVFFLTNLIGSISQSSGLPFPVILRLSMGFSGARYLGLIRGLIGIFMFGVQTFFISKSLGYIFRIILFKIDSQLLNHEILLIFFFGLNAIDFLSLILCLIIQFILFTKTAGFNKNFIKFSSIIIYVGLIILSTNTENFISRNNIFPFISVVGTMFAYFSILLLNFGDFARYAKNKNEMNKGNFALLLNLVLFSAIALLICLGSDIILAQNSITVERLLTNPNDIIGKINNNYLTIISLMLILISSISSNLIANYIPSQNTLINFLPNSLNLKSSGAVIILLALFVSFFWLSIFSQGVSLSVFDTLASFLGPIFGVLIADFYFVQNKKINHKELFYPEETTIYIYNNGWNLKALYSVLIGFIFSASTIWNINLLNIQSFGWLIGALVSYILYLLLKK
jgi:NCS1 family nucleobase:cation symporter-1